MMNSPLKHEFADAVAHLYRRCVRELNYRAKGFNEMVTMMGAVGAVKAAISADQLSDGFTRLAMERRLHLSVEALVVENERFHPLFVNKEIELAHRRLRDAGYDPKSKYR